MVTDDQKKLSLLADDLAALENYIHDLFSFSPLPICFVSPVGVILEVNPSFERLSKFKSYELIGEAINKVFKKEEIDVLAEDTSRKDFVDSREMTFYTKEAKELKVHAFTRIRKDENNETVGYFLGLFNLTNVKTAEDELKKAQIALMNILEDTEEARMRAEGEKNKTQTIVNSLSDGLMVFSSQDRVSTVNPRTEELLNIKQDKLIGKSIASLGRIPKTKQLARLIESSGKRLFRKELNMGENFILEVTTIQLVSENVNIGMLVVLHDVSREKMIERMKTEFVSISAHQLRTPLSAIKWTLKMLLDGDLGQINKDQREFIGKTYESNEKMINLINDLLNVTRIEEGRYLYSPVPADLCKIIKSMVNNYSDEASKKDITLTLIPTEHKPPKISLDVEKIQLAFQNLIENAIRYTHANGKVTVSVNYDKKKIVVCVKDSGIGVPKDQKNRIFTKFFRGANVIKMETEGSGLGLFITKNVIESHGGRVWFESKEGQGSSFCFSIPVSRKKEK
jgi:PAS domain S-box-containing protein